MWKIAHFWGGGGERGHSFKVHSTKQTEIPRYPCLCSCALRLNYTNPFPTPAPPPTGPRVVPPPPPPNQPGASPLVLPNHQGEWRGEGTRRGLRNPRLLLPAAVIGVKQRHFHGSEEGPVMCGARGGRHRRHIPRDEVLTVMLYHQL